MGHHGCCYHLHAFMSMPILSRTMKQCIPSTSMTWRLGSAYARRPATTHPAGPPLLMTVIKSSRFDKHNETHPQTMTSTSLGETIVTSYEQRGLEENLAKLGSPLQLYTMKMRDHPVLSLNEIQERPFAAYQRRTVAARSHVEAKNALEDAHVNSPPERRN